MPTDPRQGTPEQNLITGGLPVDFTTINQDKINVAVGGAPSTDDAFAALNNAGSASTVDLDQLYSENLQKTLGLNIGYSLGTEEPFYGFDKPARWGTGRDWVASYYKDPVTWNAVLLASGYYRGKDDPRLGLKADSYLSSFGQLLTDAAASRKTITELLGGTFSSYVDGFNSGKISIDAMMGSRSGGRGSRRAPLRVEVSNPEDLKEAARSAAVNTLGYTPDDGFLGEFVKLYQGMQTGYQKKAYAAAETGGKVTQPGSPQIVAQDELRDDYETGAAGFGVVQAFQGLLDIMGAER